jgi:hypothetical protein
MKNPHPKIAILPMKDGVIRTDSGTMELYDFIFGEDENGDLRLVKALRLSHELMERLPKK